MLGIKRIANQQLVSYATRTDFCRIFAKDMNRLYLLSFLLTGDRSMAERCFVRGLDNSAKGNPVFKEWAQSWARRTIILNAIHMIKPQPTDNSAAESPSDRSAGYAVTPAEIAGIVELPAFERFAFVMSVLERYSDQDCSLLLGCSAGDVFAARTRALRQIADAAESRRKLLSINSDKAVPENSESATQREAISPLPLSA